MVDGIWIVPSTRWVSVTYDFTVVTEGNSLVAGTATAVAMPQAFERFGGKSVPSRNEELAAFQ